jgi:hypothetical protein
MLLSISFNRPETIGVDFFLALAYSLLTTVNKSEEKKFLLPREVAQGAAHLLLFKLPVSNQLDSSDLNVMVLIKVSVVGVDYHVPKCRICAVFY